MNKQFYVYIMTNKRHTVLYTGVTGDLQYRAMQHKEKVTPGFTERYNVNKLTRCASLLSRNSIQGYSIKTVGCIALVDSGSEAGMTAIGWN